MRWALAMLATGVLGCGDNLAHRDGGPVSDDGGVPRDARVAGDAAVPLTFVDFAVTGCAAPVAGTDADAGVADAGSGSADAGSGAATCLGTAPLTLDFVALAPAPIDLYEWRFGDGTSPDDSAAPRHVFSLPGTYDLSLAVQGPGGTASTFRSAAVVVAAAPLGARCTADGQCLGGECICDGGSCGGTDGFCADRCPSGSCDQALCSNLAPTSPPAPADWQDALCLLDCSTDGCPAGLACRDVLSAAGGFVRACFAAGLVRDVGDSCVDGDGNRDAALCAGGVCLAEGLRGLCSASCTANSCPAGTACATFASGSVCLRRCASAACDGDPWLGCELAGGPGAKGFVVDESPSAAGYCAPKTCTAASQCPGGACTAGFCGPS